MIKKFSLFTMMLFSVSAILAQFGVSADISPRAELRHGYRVLPMGDEKGAAHVNQRTRLNFSFDKDNLRTYISMQDVRVWGQEAQKVHNPSLAIHQAWAELLFSDSLSVKVGRQELRYDNQRFLSINDWIPMAQKHDLVLLKYASPIGLWHLGTAFNQPYAAYQRNFFTEYGINNYKYMNYIWYNTQLGNDGSISVLGLLDGYENVANTNLTYVRGTWSVYAKYRTGQIDWMINPALQHGKTPAGQDIQAYYLRGEGARDVSSTYNITLGFELLSGNNPNDGSKYRVFDPTHGAGHANSGYMDYFTNYPAHTRGAGLVNPFVMNRFKVTDRATFDADLHLFFTHSDFYFSESPINNYLGTEIDLTYNYKFNDFTNIVSGFSWMFASESMEIINRGGTLGSKNEPAYFAYIMLRIRPKIF